MAKAGGLRGVPKGGNSGNVPTPMVEILGVPSRRADMFPVEKLNFCCSQPGTKFPAEKNFDVLGKIARFLSKNVHFMCTLTSQNRRNFSIDSILRFTYFKIHKNNIKQK